MAVTQKEIEASPVEVFEVLMDPRHCAHWVVGAKEVRKVDATWPELGSAFHHTLGVGVFTLKDKTILTEFERPGRLVLHARARPAGVAEVVLELRATERGCMATMRERPISGPAKLVPRPIMEVMINLRNKESLRRLAQLAQGERKKAC